MPLFNNNIIIPLFNIMERFELDNFSNVSFGSGCKACRGVEKNGAV